MERIDWLQQWALFAPDFRDGLAHLDLSPFGGTSILCLAPGGGFGDFSHPTTRLTLTLMAPLVKGETVIDIGCGSGILSLAAVLLGAKNAIGLDICQEALLHSKENAKLNKIAKQLRFAKHLDHSWLSSQEPSVIVMNMISSEQEEAWRSLPLLHSYQATIVTSGILASQRDLYLEQARLREWILIAERQEEQWMGFVFVRQ